MFRSKYIARTTVHSTITKGERATTFKKAFYTSRKGRIQPQWNVPDYLSELYSLQHQQSRKDVRRNALDRPTNGAESLSVATCTDPRYAQR